MLKLPISPKLRPQFMRGLVLYFFIALVIVLFLTVFGITDVVDVIVVPFFGAFTLYYGYGFAFGIAGLQRHSSSVPGFEDLSSKTQVSPIHGTVIEEIIQNLGFNFFAQIGRNEVIENWVYRDESNETLIMLDNAGHIRFVSIYIDGYLDETDIKRYQIITTPVIKQYENAYRAHKQLVQTSSTKVGRPMVTRDIQTWINWHKKFGYREIRKDYLKHVRWWGGFMLIFLPIWIIYLFQLFPIYEDIKSFLRILPISFFPFALISFVSSGVLNFGAPESSNRDKRKSK